VEIDTPAALATSRMVTAIYPTALCESPPTAFPSCVSYSANLFSVSSS
jgi:hypothetical protein